MTTQECIEVIKKECLNTLKIMSKKTSGWHGDNYKRLHKLCKEDKLTKEEMEEIVKNHNIFYI